MTTKLFVVRGKALVDAEIVVEADNEKDALKLAKNGEGDLHAFGDDASLEDFQFHGSAVSVEEVDEDYEEDTQ